MADRSDSIGQFESSAGRPANRIRGSDEAQVCSSPSPYAIALDGPYHEMNVHCVANLRWLAWISGWSPLIRAKSADDSYAKGDAIGGFLWFVSCGDACQVSSGLRYGHRG
jgi:hypothetical protein